MGLVATTEVPIAPHLSVTFSQPMIAVTSHDDTIAKGVPVKLTPTPPGRWRWVGTRTLLFDPVVRFPMATKYTVEIPEGTKSESGVVLKKKKSFTFGTPAPIVKSSWPSDSKGPQPLNPVMFVRFDQKIDAAIVLKSIEVQAGKAKYSVRAVTPAEIENDAHAKSLVDGANKSEQAGYWVAFRVDEDLPKASKVSVTIKKGTPSAEGPRKTKNPQSFSFRTYHPLQVWGSKCNRGHPCLPSTAWEVKFSTPIDAEKFDPSTIEVEPKLPNMRVAVNDQWMAIWGLSKGRTTYAVTLPASLTDKYGQTLGKPKRLTFKVTDANPRLFRPSDLVILDPAAKKRTFDIHSINIESLDIKVYKVSPKDWDEYARFMRKNPLFIREDQPAPGPPPGEKVVETTISPKKDVDRVVETCIDLESALNSDGYGHAIVVVEPTRWPNRVKPYILAWVQATDIGLDAFQDATDLLTWVTNLKDGKPLPGVQLELVPFGIKQNSSKQGTATLALPPGKESKGKAQMVLAENGTDVAFILKRDKFWPSVPWRKRDPGQSLRWFVYDDRHMYRPSESVHLKGWIRKVDNREQGDIGGLDGAATTVKYTVSDPRGNEITQGRTRVNALGGFDLEFKLPKTPNLGRAKVAFEAKGKGTVHDRTYQHVFQIQEFRRPEYEVSTKASQGPHIIGKGADVEVKAAYFAGGGLPDADVDWRVSATPTNFTPPNRDMFTFGTWMPWWLDSDPRFNHPWYQGFKGKTDGTGQHVLHLDFVSIRPARPMRVKAQASVTDINRQSWTASSTLLVHPSELYVGLRRAAYFAERGKPIELSSMVVDQEGRAVAGTKVTIKAVRLDWKHKDGQWREEEVDPQYCEVQSTQDPVDCAFKTPEGGTYRITATVTDQHGRPNQTQLLHWVGGGELPPQRSVTQEEVHLVPSAQEYKPGDTAKLLVIAPFYPGEALVTTRRSGILTTRVVPITGPSTTIEVPIQEQHIPNVYVQVDVVGSAERVDDDGHPNTALPRRPAYAMGRIELPVSAKARMLGVEVKPKVTTIEPGGKTLLEVWVKDSRGNPVRGAEMSLIVVDESVLSLSEYKTPDPVSGFYLRREPTVTDFHQREYVRLAQPDKTALLRDPACVPESGVGEEIVADPNTLIAVREDFNALALFAPEVRTDHRGRATVRVKVPDNLTRYRIMAVVVSGEKSFGSGESSITARMPLMVRPSPPRFLNFGDKFELPVLLQNQTNEQMNVMVAVRSTNAAITDGLGRRIMVPANDRVEVRFPAAAEMPGTARFQVGASAGRWADAAEFALSVWTPATSEAFATYGEINEGAIEQSIKVPNEVVEEFGGLEVTTSSTQLQVLTDAFVYLLSYPYECTEQTSSRVLAIAALRDVLHAFNAKGLPSKSEIEGVIDRDLARLKELQNYDGGFAFWTRGHNSWPYVSVHAAHALARAEAKSYVVDKRMMSRIKAYLWDIDKRIPSSYPVRVKRTLRAYALYVRSLMGDTDIKSARALLEEASLDGIPIEALGWLMGTMTGDTSAQDELERIHRYLDGKVIETAAAAHWTTSYSDGAHLILHSSRRADGVILESLIRDRPKSDLIPKVVRGLLAHRERGRWGNTQENSFVLLAMDAYFNKYEKVTPALMARIWLGGKFAGQEKFKGRENKQYHVDIPMSYLTKAGTKPQDLVLQKQGEGRLYYRVGMTYAPESLWLAPVDHGFAVERVYESVDDPGDVKRLENGMWKVKAGSRVRVRLTMAAEARRYYVALVDKLPAGFEPLNPALVVTGAIPQDPNEQKNEGRYWWWLRSWYEHQNMRDERVEAFTSLLAAGVHEYTYITRATTPGHFVVPPAMAEEMYFPETFGRSASTTVIVE